MNDKQSAGDTCASCKHNHVSLFENPCSDCLDTWAHNKSAYPLYGPHYESTVPVTDKEETAWLG